jgi:hypothetical protein
MSQSDAKMFVLSVKQKHIDREADLVHAINAEAEKIVKEKPDSAATAPICLDLSRNFMETINMDSLLSQISVPVFNGT